MIYATRCLDAELIMLLSFCAMIPLFMAFLRPVESYLRCGSVPFYDARPPLKGSRSRDCEAKWRLYSARIPTRWLLCKNRFRSISVGDLRFNLALTTSRRQARLIARPRPIASMKRGVQRILPRSITADIPNIPDLLSPEIQSRVENMATREQQQSDSFNNLFYF